MRSICVVAASLIACGGDRDDRAQEALAPPQDCPRVQSPATVVCPVKIADVKPTDLWNTTADSIRIEDNGRPGKRPITTICNFCRKCEVTIGDPDTTREPTCLAGRLEFIDGCDDPPMTEINDGCTVYTLTIDTPSDEAWEAAKKEDYPFFGQYCKDYLKKNPKRIEELGDVCTEDSINHGDGATYTDHDGSCCDRGTPDPIPDDTSLGGAP